mmetsp:Transcript_29721/g.81386  ORF Transcript_29721/g.81386 Transcript_29721/m.81386 type:complete len:522 (-) Transcript_29721:235-1800(-)
MARPCSSGSLSDFKELSLLGEGAFSAVYKVRRLADGATYALKKVKLPSLNDKEKQNALNEIRLLASVRHENVISYKDAFFDDRSRCLCIVTECADGGDLLQQITKAQKERTHLREVDIWRYLIGLCHGLQALHSMRILHRDMKSANVFISSSPSGLVAKLGDFNVSTVAKRGLCMTQTGTPYYASPEVWRDIPYDGKSDIWSLACVIYEAAGLKPPFQAKDMEGLCKRVLRGKYQRIPAHFSEDLSDTISAMLQVNPRLRPSAEELLHMPAVHRRAVELGLAQNSSSRSDLLSTIKVPRNVVDLSAFLPRPQYEDVDAITAAPQALNLASKEKQQERVCATECGDGEVSARRSNVSERRSRAQDGLSPASVRRSPAAELDGGGDNLDACVQKASLPPLRVPGVAAQAPSRCPASKAQHPSHGGGLPRLRSVPAPQRRSSRNARDRRTENARSPAPEQHDTPSRRNRCEPQRRANSMARYARAQYELDMRPPVKPTSGESAAPLSQGMALPRILSSPGQLSP